MNTKSITTALLTILLSLAFTPLARSSDWGFQKGDNGVDLEMKETKQGGGSSKFEFRVVNSNKYIKNVMVVVTIQSTANFRELDAKRYKKLLGPQATDPAFSFVLDRDQRFEISTFSVTDR